MFRIISSYSPSRYYSDQIKILIVGLLLVIISARLSAAYDANAALEIKPAAPDALLFSTTVMAPLNPLAELLSFSVTESARTTTISYRGKSIVFTIGEAAANVNGKEITLQMPPFIRAGVWYIPVEKCVVALGGTYSVLENASHIRIKIPGVTPLNLPLRAAGAESKWFRDDHESLFAISINGSGIRRLTYNASDDKAPIFSPDGKLMLYQRDNDFYIRSVKHAAGGFLFNSHANSQRSYRISAFTPDGKSVLFVQQGRNDETGDENSNIGLISLSGRKRMWLGKGHSPMITPNGKYIIYGYRNNDTTVLLRIMTVKGKDNRLLIDGDEPIMHSAQQLLFFQRRYCDLANARGSEMPVYRLLTCYRTDNNQYPQRLLEPLEGQITGDETEAVFSNDGSNLSFRKTGHGLFIINFPQQKRRQLTTNAADTSPRFSNNTKIIFLRQRVLMSINIENGTEQVIYAERPVLSFSITPDGNNIIFSALPEDKSFNLFLGE